MGKAVSIPPPFVKITPKDNNTINVMWGFTTLKKIEADGKISCYVPAFDFYFSAADDVMREKKGRIMSFLFFDHFFIHNKNNALKMLALELHKKGFKTTKDMYDMGQFVKNKAINAKFKSVGIKPPEFKNAESVHQECEMEIA